MRPTLPISLAAALLALLVGGAAPAGAATGLSPARGFAPRHLIVKLDGERRAHTLSLPAGAGVRATAAALRDNPGVEYAAPNYIATAAASFTLPDDPGTLTGSG